MAINCGEIIAAVLELSHERLETGAVVSATQTLVRVKRLPLPRRAESLRRPSELARPGPHARIEFDLAEGVLVVHQVLLQDGVQRLRLLRAK